MKYTDEPNVAFPSYVMVRMYEGVEELNYGLASAIREHATRAVAANGEPAGGGFRSDEGFLDTRDQAVSQLKKMLTNAATGYLEQGLPHLFENVESLRGGVAIAGWARILRSRQAVEPHTHAGGLVTGSYYVSVPKAVAETDAVDGDLVLENPFAAAIDAETPLKVRAEMPIAVNEGMLFLHPPFLPHRVPAFEGGGERLSVSFLVTPRGAA